MSSVESDQNGLHLAVRNVGGIDQTEVELSSGVTALTGRNATNRTSLLRALMAAMGSDDVSLKGDANEGRVELSIQGETYTRTLERSNGTVTTGGDPFFEDSTAADLFTFLLETNEARQAVPRDEDLRELIMRPVDTDELEAEIRRLEQEKRQLDAEIGELEGLEQELPELRSERARLGDEIDETADELETLEAEIDEHSADPETRREEESEFEATMQELRSARSDLEELRYDADAQERSLEALEEEREELEGQREEFPTTSADTVTDLEAEIEQRRRQKRDIDTELNELQSVIQFNEEMLDDQGAELQAALGDDDGDVTDQLAPDDATTCWTCGSEVGSSQIEATLDKLRELRRSKRERQRSIDDEIDELETEKIGYEERKRQRDQIDRDLERVEQEIERREERLSELRERRTEQEGRVEDLEDEVESLEPAEESELLSLHREANQLEFELGRLRTQLDDVNEDITTVEDRLEGLSDAHDRRESIDQELDELRSRIRTLEREAVDAFNDHMASLLDLLEYANLERIWIERIENAGGRGPSDDAAFKLHVVRSTESDVTYEDSVGHLSESEREVTGLVFALAGYLVHDLSEEVPMILLDSLEAIDSTRIADLVEYFADYADFLVAALLPEDAASLDDAHDRVTDI